MDSPVKIKVRFPDNIIKRPFQICPFCRAERLGILDVMNGIIKKKCDACGFIADESLPRVRKKTLYLDQFVISHFAKAKRKVESGQPVPDQIISFWSLYQKIKPLVQLQALACPISLTHDEESILADNSYDDIIAMQKELSADCTILSTYEIQNLQVRYFSEMLFKKGQVDFENGIKIYINEPHQWDSRTHVDTDLSRTHWKPNLLSEKKNSKEALEPVYKRWRETQDKTFNEWFAEEIGTYHRYFRKGIEALLNRSSP